MSGRCVRLHVSIEKQVMTYYEGSRLAKVYSISTSKNPPSSVIDSYGTPTGLHAIAEKIGGGAPLGTVFKGRVSQGKTFSEWDSDEEGLITSRILRLKGLEDANQTTFERYIYIHGTDMEDRIGTPFSKGCINMRNTDVIELYDKVEMEDLVEIV